MDRESCKRVINSEPVSNSVIGLKIDTNIFVTGMGDNQILFHLLRLPFTQPPNH